MSAQSCCIAYALTANPGVHWTVGDGSAADQGYNACMANPSAYNASGQNCGSANNPPGTTVVPSTPSTPSGGGGSSPVQDVCPAFSISDPGPALQCFAFQILRYLFVNIAAAGVFYYGLKIAFPATAAAAVSNVKSVGKAAAEE